MSNGNHFNFLSFLAGLAIGLWISMLVLFVANWGKDCNCGAGGTTITNVLGAQEAWIPGGDGKYFCTNNDQGRSVVIDQGRAVVADQGRSVVADQGRSVVADQGRAVVADQGGFVPAPRSAQLGEERGFEDFKCAANEDGGAMILDRAGKAIVVSMPATFQNDRCGILNGKAIVTDAADFPINLDADGNVVVIGDEAVTVDAVATAEVDLDPADPKTTHDPPLAYCMITLDDDEAEPVVFRPAGTP